MEGVVMIRGGVGLTVNQGFGYISVKAPLDVRTVEFQVER